MADGEQKRLHIEHLHGPHAVDQTVACVGQVGCVSPLPPDVGTSRRKPRLMQSFDRTHSRRLSSDGALGIGAASDQCRLLCSIQGPARNKAMRRIQSLAASRSRSRR